MTYPSKKYGSLLKSNFESILNWISKRDCVLNLGIVQVQSILSISFWLFEFILCWNQKLKCRPKLSKYLTHFCTFLLSKPWLNNKNILLLLNSRNMDLKAYCRQVCLFFYKSSNENLLFMQVKCFSNIFSYRVPLYENWQQTPPISWVALTMWSMYFHRPLLTWLLS